LRNLQCFVLGTIAETATPSVLGGAALQKGGLAFALRSEVYRLVNSREAAQRDDQFRAQIFDCAASVSANIAEGWARFSAPEFCQFLRYARASLEEAKVWLKDGVARRYFDDTSIDLLLRLADRCAATITALWRSLQPFTKKPR
jgi:four helix bundle protein